MEAIRLDIFIIPSIVLILVVLARVHFQREITNAEEYNAYASKIALASLYQIRRLSCGTICTIAMADFFSRCKKHEKILVGYPIESMNGWLVNIVGSYLGKMI